MAPISWNGSQIIYSKVVRPIFLRHEAMVDNMVNDLGGRAMAAAENLTREGSDQFSTRTLWLHYVLYIRLNVPNFSLYSSLHAGEEESSGDSGAAGR